MISYASKGRFMRRRRRERGRREEEKRSTRGIKMRTRSRYK